MPGGFVCSASCKGVATGREVLDVSAGKMPLRSLFSKEQRAFYDANAPAGIELNSLLTLGPTFLLRSKHQPKDFERGITVEMWLYPDGSRILEISTKCLPSEAFQAAAEPRHRRGGGQRSERPVGLQRLRTRSRCERTQRRHLRAANHVGRNARRRQHAGHHDDRSDGRCRIQPRAGGIEFPSRLRTRTTPEPLAAPRRPARSRPECSG